jgi:hypothetical protein
MVVHYPGLPARSRRLSLNPAVAGATGPGLALAQEVRGRATVTPGVGQALPPAGLYVEEWAGESACPTPGQPRPTAGFRLRE